MRKYLTYRHIRIAMWLIVLVVGGYTIQQVKDEGKVREEQFCQLVVGNYNDRAIRLRGTEKFLDSPAGDSKDPLIEYIRKISLPQTRDELAKERQNIPRVCLPIRSSEDG